MNTITYKHRKYWTIAIKYAEKAVKLGSKLKSIGRISKIRIKFIQQYLLKKESEKYLLCSEYIDIIICMCGFSLEAFINFYAIHFELDQLPGYNEKDSSIKKWEKYPVQRGRPKPSDTLIKRIKKLMDDRNDIGHYKPVSGSSEYLGFSLKDALVNLNELSEIYQEFGKIDPLIKLPHITFEIPNFANKIALSYVAKCNKSWKKSNSIE